MNFIPMAQAPADPNMLKRQLMMQLLSQQPQASTMGGAVGQGLQTLAQGLAGRMMVGGAQTNQAQQQQALAEMLRGTPAQMGQTLPGDPGGLQGLQPGTPGLMGDVDPRMIEMALLMPGGAEQLMQVAMQRAMPEPLTPYQQAQLDLSERGVGLQERGMDLDASQFEQRMAQDQGQFGERMGLERAQLAATQAYQNAKLKLDEAEIGASGGVKLSDVAGIRKEYTGASEDFVKMRDAYGKITAAGDDVSPAGDLSLIFNFMKMLDPGSTVREGEFAQVAASGALGEQWTGWGNMLITGQRLTDAQRSDVLAQTANTMRSQLGHQLRTETEFGNLAEEYGVPRRHVTPDLIGDLREGVAAVERVASEPPGSLLRRGAEAAQGALGAVEDMLGRGDTGEAPAAPQAPAAGEEGLTATNPETGERVIWRNGRWEPL